MIGNLEFNRALIISGFNMLRTLGRQSFSESMARQILDSGYKSTDSQALANRFRLSCTVSVLGSALVGFCMGGLPIAALAATIATIYFHVFVSWPVINQIPTEERLRIVQDAVEKLAKSSIARLNIVHARMTTVTVEKFVEACKQKGLGEKVVSLTLEGCQLDRLPPDFFEVFTGIVNIRITDCPRLGSLPRGFQDLKIKGFYYTASNEKQSKAPLFLSKDQWKVIEGAEAGQWKKEYKFASGVTIHPYLVPMKT